MRRERATRRESKRPSKPALMLRVKLFKWYTTTTTAAADTAATAATSTNAHASADAGADANAFRPVTLTPIPLAPPRTRRCTSCLEWEDGNALRL